MVRPPDDLRLERGTIIVGQGTTLDRAPDYPLMSDATRWGDLLFLSGRAAVDPATGTVRAADFAGQLEIVIADAFEVLEKAGSNPDNVLRVECWLLDQDDFGEWNRQYAEAFPPPRPARTTLVIAGLPIEGLLVELQLTAAIPA
jgi:2-iminobutanoate/2-iminopropanoate deaminase